ncbi:DMT family transporter [Actimicrobium antarcticum]|uniref:DMT family transporter n=1 Tax=Actimicrobium antarcticum TaxID=1051899 RepID=A0ABP7TMX9_9BURK
MTTPVKVVFLTALAMIAFAANSILCRIALKQSGIDPATFTVIRITAGALMLWLIVRLRRTTATSGSAVTSTGNWRSALALFVYAAGFSFAYISLSAATGALLLFGAVQATMISYGLWSGERIGRWQVAGLTLACIGIVFLLLPGLSAPPLAGALLMVCAGIAWGVYSLRARGAGDPLLVTAGNFMRAVPLALVFGLTMLSHSSADPTGVAYAIISGAVASGLGYAIWYTALRGLTASTAATVQLSVPVLATVGGMLFLGEPITQRFVLASVAILGGLALFVLNARRRR